VAISPRSSHPKSGRKMAAKVINASLVTCRRKTGENQGGKLGGKLSRRLPILLFCLWTWRKSLNFLPRASDFPAPSFSQLPNEAAGKSQRGLVVINNLAKSRGKTGLGLLFCLPVESFAAQLMARLIHSQPSYYYNFLCQCGLIEKFSIKNSRLVKSTAAFCFTFLLGGRYT